MLFVGGLGCVLSVGISFAVVEFAASGKGRVGGTTDGVVVGSDEEKMFRAIPHNSGRLE